MGRSAHTVKKDAVALVIDSKENGVEVNADKTKCMAISRDQDARRSHSIKIHDSSFEMVEEFIHLRTTITNQISI